MVNYDLKIHKLNRKIAILKSKKRLEIKKENNKKRKKRARKLLKLGIIFEVTAGDIYDIELIIGYLSQLKLLSNQEQEKYRMLGEKILNKITLEKHDKEEVKYLSTEERRKRNHKLISLGALFEMTETDSLDLAIQIGYIDELHTLDILECQKLEDIGKKYSRKQEENR